VSAHTPGKWRWEFNSGCGQWMLIQDREDEYVPVKIGGSPTMAITPDMQLTAASPDLLSALRPLIGLLPALFDALDLDLETSFNIKRSDDDSSLYKATLEELINNGSAAIARATA